ncbi:MAG: hypothetical protein ACRD45_07465 [Bryobacteraceae bacterium]
METRAADKKLQILKAGGYRYSFDRQLYFNRAAKKAFSVQFIEDNSEDDIARLIRQESSNPEWRFFFNTTPSAAVERELASVLG